MTEYSNNLMLYVMIIYVCGSHNELLPRHSTSCVRVRSRWLKFNVNVEEEMKEQGRK